MTAQNKMPGRRQRQRLEEPEGEEGPQGVSKLGRWLIEQWAWGKLSPQQVQTIAGLANDDIQKALETKESMWDLQRLSSLGGSSHRSSNMHRDLVAKLGTNPFQLQSFQIPLAHLGMVHQLMLLPHVAFATIYSHYSNYFYDKVIDPDLHQQFWAEVPDREGVLQGRDFRRAIPISLHGDAVPVTGAGKSWSKSLDILSWSSMVGKGSTLQRNFIIWVVFVQMQSQTWGSRTVSSSLPGNN